MLGPELIATPPLELFPDVLARVPLPNDIGRLLAGSIPLLREGPDSPG